MVASSDKREVSEEEEGESCWKRCLLADGKRIEFSSRVSNVTTLEM